MTELINTLSESEKEVIHILFANEPINYDMLVKDAVNFGTHNRSEIESATDKLQSRDLLRVNTNHHPNLIDWNHDLVYDITKHIYREWVMNDTHIDSIDLTYFNYDLESDDEFRTKIVVNNLTTE